MDKVGQLLIFRNEEAIFNSDTLHFKVLSRNIENYLLN